MKKNVFLTSALIVIITLFSSNFTTSRPAFVPDDALWHIAISPGNMGCYMSWYETSNHGDWGQGQCSMPGSVCHCSDWCTWWYPNVWHPAPPAGWTVIYGDVDFPTYDPQQQKYVY